MELEEKYPDLFKRAGCECGEGWDGIIEIVCEKLKNRGIHFSQIKEKFGTLRIYLDSYYQKRISGAEVFGLKDGKIVEKEIYGSEPIIKFHDSKFDGAEFIYIPNKDEFFDINMEYVEIQDKEFIKGRLAQFTEIVDSEPIEEELVDDIIDWAEAESAKTCEECGSKEDITTEGSWLKTLCKTCREKIAKRFVEHAERRLVINKSDSNRVEKYKNEICKILGILGHPEALVTDESKIWDFIFSEPDKIENISKQIGFEVRQSDHLVDVAEKMKMNGV